MLDIQGWVEALLQQVDAATITNVFLLSLLAVAVVAFVQARRGAWSGFINYTPNLLTSLGILGTFVGIVVGLLSFDVSDIDGSMGPLLDGLTTAFTTSLAGMFLAIMFKSADSSGWLRRSVVADEPSEEVGPQEILAALRGQQESLGQLTKAISGDEESTLIGQIRLLRSDCRDHAQTISQELLKQRVLQEKLSASLEAQRETFETFSSNLWDRMEQFAEMLSKSATEQVISALRDVIAEFNNNLTEQFGENFKALDASVKRLVDWQDNYREQLAQMSEQYRQGVESIGETQRAVAQLGEDCKHIPESMKMLREILTTTQHQLAELERHLGAFADLRDRAVEALPEVRQQINKMVGDLSDAVNSASQTISEATEEANKSIAGAADALKRDTSRANEGLVAASDALAETSDQVKERFQAQMQEIGRAFQDVRDELRTSVNTTGEALNKQVQAIDTAMQREIERVMNEMGRALASIAKQFTQDYSQLVQTMDRITREHERVRQN